MSEHAKHGIVSNKRPWLLASSMQSSKKVAKWGITHRVDNVALPLLVRREL